MASIPFSDPEEYRKQFSSAAERNKYPIFEVLKGHVLKEQAEVLEVCSLLFCFFYVDFLSASKRRRNSCLLFCGKISKLDFSSAFKEFHSLKTYRIQPSDVDPVHVGLITERTRHLKNVLPAVVVDVSSESWTSALSQEV